MGQLDKVFGVGGVLIIIIRDMSPISPHVGPFHLSVFLGNDMVVCRVYCLFVHQQVILTFSNQ